MAREPSAEAGEARALLLAEASIRDVDLNLVIVYLKGQGVLALDALMLVEGS